MKITIINNKGTDVELGKRLVEMGFERKRNTKGAVFRVEGI
jgi:Fe2+ transport system protein FeoA